MNRSSLTVPIKNRNRIDAFDRQQRFVRRRHDRLNRADDIPQRSPSVGIDTSDPFEAGSDKLGVVRAETSKPNHAVLIGQMKLAKVSPLRRVKDVQSVGEDQRGSTGRIAKANMLHATAEVNASAHPQNGVHLLGIPK